jgi:hypothetical protein
VLLERLQLLLEAHEPWDIHITDEMCLLQLPPRKNTYEGQSYHREKSAKEMTTVIECVSSDGSYKHTLIAVRKSLRPYCFITKYASCQILHKLKAWMIMTIFMELKAL